MTSSLLSPPRPNVLRLNQRGVYYLNGCVKCPLAGLGARGDYASNRIVLDDDHSLVEVDLASGRIVWSNEHSYDHYTMIGDILSLGLATTRTGATMPFAVHTPIEKRGRAFDPRRDHIHPAGSEDIVAAKSEPFEIVFNDGKRRRRLPAETPLDALRRPPLASRLKRQLIEVRNESGADAGWTRGACPIHLTVRFGIGPLSKLVLSAQLHCLDDVGTMPASLADLFVNRDCRLTLMSHSNLRDPRDHIRRALFLLGLEGVPVLRRVKTHGLKMGESLSIRLTSGRGFVEYGNAMHEMENAIDVARLYLEFDFVGAVLAYTLMGRFESPSQRSGSLPSSIVL